MHPAVRAPATRWANVLVVPVVSGLLLALCVALDVVTPATGPGPSLAPGPGWPYAALGLGYGVAAGFVLRHDVRQGFGWVLAWFGVFWVLDGLAQSWVRYGARADDVLAGVGLAAWILFRAGAFLPLTVVVLLLLFPTGRLLPGRWDVAGRIAVAVMALAALLVVVSPMADTELAGPVPPGLDLDRATLPLPPELVTALRPVSVLGTAIGVLIGIGSVLQRYRVSDTLDRSRMRWLLWAVVVMTMLVAGSALAGLGGDAVVIAAAGLPVAAMTVGVVRPQVVPIEDLISDTVVLGVLVLGLVGLDLLALWALGTALGTAPDERQVVVVVVLVTVVVAAPARRLLTQLARRLLFGVRGERYDVVAGLASRLEGTREGAEQLAVVARTIGQAFGVGYVAIEVEREGAERLVVAHGTPPERTHTVPITDRGTPVGRLVMPAGGVRSRLSRRDEQLLSDLVRQVAIAARSARLADQLQRSRERLVLAREEERRRIRRDLHDGLGPALGGAVFGLESARLLLDRDPSAASHQLVAVRDQLQQTVSDVRALVHDLRPAALDDRGLVVALREQADRLGSGDRPRIAVRADDRLDPLPAAVEVAAYRIAGEALTNVVRHAGASTCTLTLRRDGEALLVEVVDDGCGIPADAQAGVGLESLRERAAELGGTTRITCPPQGGTVVRAWLPVHEPQHEAPSGEAR